MTSVMAGLVAALWATVMKFDDADPDWPDRDRFLLSDASGADASGAGLPAALRRLTGHSQTDAGAPLPKHDKPAGPHACPDADISVAAIGNGGASGHGLATAVGMAVAERALAARFGRSLIDHRTWAVASPQDIAGGLSHEAICLAGELRLARLTVLYDAGAAPVSDLAKRFHAAGWTVREMDGRDPDAISGGLSFALRGRRPSLLCCRYNPADPREATHLQADLAPKASAERSLQPWAAAGQRGAAARRAWLKRLALHPQRADFERAVTKRRPDEWREAMAVLRHPAKRSEIGSAPASDLAFDALLGKVPELLSCVTSPRRLEPAGTPEPAGDEAYRGRRLSFGLRRHGMAAAMNGITLHGGWLPIAWHQNPDTDGLPTALRLAATLQLQVIHVFTAQDDRPNRSAHPPAEQLASLRAIPNLLVFRPADPDEAADCWEVALRRPDGPSAIFLSDHTVPPLPSTAADHRAARGAHLLVEPSGRRAATLIASGAEVAIALQAQAALAAEGLAVAVVSLPCWELFAQQDEPYRQRVLGTAPRIGIEAACAFGWERWLGSKGRFIGITGIAAGTTAENYCRFGITPDAVIEAVKARVVDSKAK